MSLTRLGAEGANAWPHPAAEPLVARSERLRSRRREARNTNEEHMNQPGESYGLSAAVQSFLTSRRERMLIGGQWGIGRKAVGRAVFHYQGVHDGKLTF
jgi:hypothetical protein